MQENNRMSFFFHFTR